MSDQRTRGRKTIRHFTRWFPRLSQPSTDAGNPVDAGGEVAFVPRSSSRSHGVPFGDPDLYLLAGMAAGELDNEQRALLSCYHALRKAHFWPFGPRPFDHNGRRTMHSVAALLASHHVTLKLDIDLGPDLYGMLIYPQRVIFMNHRLFGDWQDDGATHGVLRIATVMLFAAYLIQPAYVDALTLSPGFESDTNAVLRTALWRTATWMAIEMLLPGPLLNRVIREGAHLQREQGDIPVKTPSPIAEAVGRYVHPTPAAHLARLTAGCAAELAQLKIEQLTEGVARAIDNGEYGPAERKNPLWPYATREVAEVLSAYDWTGLHKLWTVYLRNRQQSRTTGRTPPPLPTTVSPALRSTPAASSLPTLRLNQSSPYSHSQPTYHDESEADDIGSGPLGPLPFPFRV